jgi:NADPH:quinone reductase-like Zn-dependent oxidoreductase
MELMKAIRIHNYGGPEVLQYEDAPRPKPKPGEVLIRVHAAGVNNGDFSTWFAFMSPVPGVLFGFLGLLIFAC